jgi:hypothetical protein
MVSRFIWKNAFLFDMNDFTWIKLYRKLLDSDIFKNEKLLKIWIWILLKANHKENTFLLGRQKMTIKSGQFVMGLNKSSDVLDLAKSTIKYWLDYLEKIGKIELKKTNKYTIIIVKNWSLYQDIELKKNSKKTPKETNNNDIRMNKNDKEDIIIPIEQSSNDKKPINEVLHEFYKINPTLNFGHAGQRKAAEDLLDKFPLDKLQSMIRWYIGQMSDRFCPVATTPLAFKNKLSDIKAYAEKLKTNSKFTTI